MDRGFYRVCEDWVTEIGRLIVISGLKEWVVCAAQVVTV